MLSCLASVSGDVAVPVQRIEAAVLRGRGGPLRLESLDLEGPRDDEVMVRIVAAGICRTDIVLCDDWDGVAQPVVLGHEGAGVVERAGKKVKSVVCGDHVVLSYQSCGRCHQCLDGHPWACRRFGEANFGFKRLDGSSALWRSGVRGHFFGQSSWATYSVATERNVVRIPKDLTLEVLAPLGCGFQTGVGTVMNSLAVASGASIAIFGTGAVGLAAVMAARLLRASPIVGADVNPARLDLALKLGATHVVNSRRDDVASRISAITGEGIDYVVETTGDPEMLQLAVHVLNPRGTAAFLTGASGPARLPGGRKAINVIQGDAAPQIFIPKLIALYRAGLLPFDRLVKTYDFSEINQAVADAKRGGTIKPVLRISKAGAG